MEKILLTLTLTLILIPCNSDITEDSNCLCDAWVIDDTNYREVLPNLEIDCETGQPINLPSNYTFLGCDNDNTH